MNNVITLLNELGINTNTGDNFDNINVVLQKISEKWVSIDQRHYLGDVKWVLYQYICDMNVQEIFIKCGNYAFEKIKNILKDCENFDSNSSGGYINGEYVRIYKVCEMNKKRVTISKYKCNCDSTIYPEDIVLYFA